MFRQGIEDVTDLFEEPTVFGKDAAELGIHGFLILDNLSKVFVLSGLWHRPVRLLCTPAWPITLLSETVLLR